ncbi:amino acid adenylation domain-containing protein [Legionella sp. km772]|uniref:amino acid adenylation domain-containing protein n=1 Tax=Legionella sp. km772 TaxID=2498111 RepID=UPI0013154B4C|nr:amino acid adenylation domain-containing protein [Legionella sp. km772]
MDYSATLHELFESEVRKSPKKSALIFNKKILSYEQLNEKANQLAHHLRLQGIKPDMPVVVCMERSFEFFIAILGILKAGGAYIPLDPNHPEERLLFILKESTATIVLTTESFQKKFTSYLGTVLLLNNELLSQQAKENPHPTATEDNLAYVIYTSGSTGTPKGVLIEHKGVVNYAAWFAQECVKGDKEKIDCSSNISFDFALTLTIVPLALGLTVVICDDAVKKDPRRYIDYLQSNGISLIKITPSYFRVLFYELQNKKTSFPHLKKIMLAGENLATIDCQHWLERYPSHRLYNEYGPTETSVAVTLFVVDKDNVHHLGDTVPIGYLLPNASYFIIKDNGELAAKGEDGELHLGGVCLARGYLNNPQLTDRYFINNPFKANKIEKLYKTGDLCRLLTSGAIECIGRIDHQLKIRGFRVELEEIEHCLASHPAIKSAVVIASDKGSKEKRLIAYYLLKESEYHLETTELREYLQRFLPDYMIPVLFVKMASFPLNANEKLDRAALPVPQGPNNSDSKAPKKLLERKLAALWSEELGVQYIGIHDNFFELGGHSLSAARVISKINHQFKKEINLQNFYQTPTIAALSLIIKKAKRVEHESIDTHSVDTKTTLPLSDFQLMLWLADTFEPKAKKLNIFTRKRIQGRLDVANLNKAFAALIQKHKILSYRISKFHPSHYLQRHQGYRIVERNLALLPENESELIIEDSFQQLKNYYPWPKNKPQIITRLFYLQNGNTELQITMPHLIADDLCPDILLKDLSDFYQQSAQQALAEENIYKEYIAHEQHYFKKHLNEDLAFWEHYLKDTRLYPFASQHIVTDMRKQGLAYSSFTVLSEDLLSKFKNYCAHHHISILDGLCAVLMLALLNCTEEEHHFPVCINRVKSTRDHEDYDQAIGCFLRLEPIKLQVKQGASLNSLAQEIHEEVMHTTPYQKCSNLVKLASISTFRQQKNLIKEYSIKLGVWLYTTITRLKLNRTILNMTGRLNAAKGQDFLININVQNNFITPLTKHENEAIFGLQVAPIQDKPSDLLQIDNLLDVCFMRIDKTAYLVLSANLTPAFKTQLADKMIKIIKEI